MIIIIQISNLTKTYVSEKKETKVALNDINISIPNNGMCFIIGKTGCGKTTLLNMIGKLDTFEKGSIVVDNVDIKTLSEKEADGYRSKYIGFIFQEYNLLENLSVYENIALSYEIEGKEVNSEEIKEVLTRLQIPNYENRMIYELSGGEKQRVAIARTLIKKPKLILADEPTGNLDNGTGKEIIEILKELSKEILVVIVSHNEDFANKYGDKIIELANGEKINEKEIKLEYNNNRNLEITKEKGLSNKRIIQFGLRNLSLKLKHLILMVLISSISFAMLAISLSLLFVDKEKIVNDTMDERGYEYGIVRVKKPFNSLEPDYNISHEMVEELRKDGLNVYPILSDEIFHIDLPQNYNYKMRGYIEVDEKICDELGCDLIYGKLPETINEVAISKYSCEFLVKHNFIDIIKGEITENEDIIGTVIVNKGTKKSFEIVGVLDTKHREYETILAGSDEWDIDQIIFVCPNYYLQTNQNNINQLAISEIEYDFGAKGTLYRNDLDETKEDAKLSGKFFIDDIKYCNEVIFFDENKTELADNEVIINLDKFYYGYLDDVIKEYYNAHPELKVEFKNYILYSDYLYESDRPEDIKLYEEFIFEGKKREFLYYYNKSPLLKLTLKTNSYKTNEYEFKIVGYCYNSKGVFFVNDNTCEIIKDENNAHEYYRLALKHNEMNIDKLSKYNLEYKTDIDNSIIHSLSQNKILLIILGIISIILSIISVLMLINYLSIVFEKFNTHNRIIRSLGVSMGETLKIFIVQGALVFIFIIILGSLMYIVLEKVLSYILVFNTVFGFDILRINLKQVSIVVGLIIISIVLSIIFIYNKIKKFKLNV